MIKAICCNQGRSHLARQGPFQNHLLKPGSDHQKPEQYEYEPDKALPLPFSHGVLTLQAEGNDESNEEENG